MKYTKLGSSGLEVSRICLGCMSFGEESPGAHDWSLDEAASRPIIEKALDLGINFFDTANAYSIGSSEEITGRALRDMANRDEVVIATKVFFPIRRGRNARGLSRKAIMTELDASLRRLGTDYIDLYQIHRWDDRTSIDETLGALHDAVTSGKVRYIGASSMWAWQFSKALYTSELRGFTKFVSMQNQYSLLQREEEREMHPLCADQGIGTIPWSPLGRGLLTRDWDETTRRSQSDPMMARRFDEAKDRPIVDRLGEVARDKGVSRAQVAMAWVLANPVVASPIVGVTKMSHLDEAVSALDVELTAEEKERLEEVYAPRANLF
ncbi:MAG: aldo/keto reductase [Acidobacteriota bacterium]|nr:aldo/keto reductase [Acidobacteriota bacterium]MDE2921484.1 aldo/keto reductase [Acidobacteriota bacterium]MDE3264639.1 aldo/keto reductase [Acidobacteriota bacterium]